MGHSLHPLDAGFGAEIRGLDLAKPLSDIGLAGLLDEFHRHHLLLFRSQDLSDRALQAFSRRLGVAENTDSGAPAAAALIYAAALPASATKSWFSTPRHHAFQHLWRRGDLLLWNDAEVQHQRDAFDAATRPLLRQTHIRRLYTAWERLAAYA